MRLKPTHGAIERAGGMATVVDAMDASFTEVARYVGSPKDLSQLILGDTQ